MNGRLTGVGVGDRTLTSVKLKKSPTPPRIFRATVAWSSILIPQLGQFWFFVHDWVKDRKKKGLLVFSGVSQQFVSYTSISYQNLFWDLQKLLTYSGLGKRLCDCFFDILCNWKYTNCYIYLWCKWTVGTFYIKKTIYKSEWNEIQFHHAATPLFC